MEDPQRPAPFGLAIAAYAAAFLAVAWPWLSGAVTIPWDAKSQFYPQEVFLARALAAGQAPFWTPDVFAGWPQIADPQSLIFSPLHLALAFATAAPSLRAFDAVTFAALFLGGLGVLLLFSERGWHPAGGVAAALAFAFGGACASRLQHTGEVLSTAGLMLALWLLVRALERTSWRAGAAAGLTAALMALGRDQVALLGLYLLAALVLAHWAAGPGRGARLRASLEPLGAGAVVGAAVVALPLLMTALLAAESNRPGFSLVEAGRGSLHPAHLLTFVFPDLYGAADPAVPYWGPPSFPWGVTGLFLAQNMGQLYAGALALVALAVAAGGGLWAREVRFLTLAAGLVLLYALGWYTPAFHAAYALLPGVTLFRRPADAAFLVGALYALLGGYGVHLWLTRPLPRRGLGLAAVLGVAAVATAIALAYDRGQLGVSAAPLAFGVLWVVAAVVALAAVRRAHRPAAAVLVLALFSAADLRWNNAPNESTGLPPATYDALRPDTTNATVRLLKERLAATAAPDRRDRVELTGIAYHWPNLGLVHGLEHVFGHNPLRLAVFAQATGVGDTVAVPDQRGFAPLFPSYRSALADLFGLRFIATGVPVEQIDRRLVPGDLTFVARTPDAYVYENPRALPRVMVLGQWQRADFARLLREGWPDGVDPRTTVLLERDPGVPTGAAGTARVLRYENTQVVIEAEAPADGILLLNDVWHPWWAATLDGRPAEILRANVLFRAVALPPGRHTIVFTFHPVAGALRQARARLGLAP